MSAALKTGQDFIFPFFKDLFRMDLSVLKCAKSLLALTVHQVFSPTLAIHCRCDTSTVVLTGRYVVQSQPKGAKSYQNLNSK